jgi:hypothetical protein
LPTSIDDIEARTGISEVQGLSTGGEGRADEFQPIQMDEHGVEVNQPREEHFRVHHNWVLLELPFGIDQVFQGVQQA